MKDADIVLVTEQGIDVFLAGEYLPARSLPDRIVGALQDDPVGAERYYGALMTSATMITGLFRAPQNPDADDPAAIETQTQALYRRRLLYTEGFTQDLAGLNKTIIRLEDTLESRISLLSLNDLPASRDARLYLVHAPRPSDIAVNQPIAVFSFERELPSGPLRPTTVSGSGSLAATAQARAGDALYVMSGVPGVIQRHPRAMRSAFVHQYLSVKRAMASSGAAHYPWIGDSAGAN